MAEPVTDSEIDAALGVMIALGFHAVRDDAINVLEEAAAARPTAPATLMRDYLAAVDRFDAATAETSRAVMAAEFEGDEDEIIAATTQHSEVGNRLGEAMEKARAVLDALLADPATDTGGDGAKEARRQALEDVLKIVEPLCTHWHSAGDSDLTEFGEGSIGQARYIRDAVRALASAEGAHHGR